MWVLSMKMLFDNYNHYWSPITHLMHLRTTARVKEVYDSYDFGKWLTEKLNAKYDLRYEGSSDELLITEFLGSISGIMVYTPDHKFNCKMLALAEECPTPRFDINRLGPKYPSFALPVPEDLETLVILPGSNILRSISEDVLRYLYDNNAYFKPHPLTNKDDLLSFKLRMGEQFLSPYEDVYPLVRAASTVVCQDSTEMGIYAALHGKKIQHLCNLGPGAAYGHMYPVIDKIALKLNTVESGLFLPSEDWDEQLERFMSHLKKVRES